MENNSINSNFKKEKYEQTLINLAPHLAQLLADGFILEIAKSRSGLKVFRTIRQHEVLNYKNGGVD